MKDYVRVASDSLLSHSRIYGVENMVSAK